MVDHRAKWRHAQSRAASPFAHGQLVAEVAQPGCSHVWNAHVLAEFGGCFHVIFVESDNAVETRLVGKIGDRVDHLLTGQILRHVADVIQAFARPVGATALLQREQHHAAAQALAFAHELLTFFVRRDAENSEWARHRGSQAWVYKTGV